MGSLRGQEPRTAGPTASWLTAREEPGRQANGPRGPASCQQPPGWSWEQSRLLPSPKRTAAFGGRGPEDPAERPLDSGPTETVRQSVCAGRKHEVSGCGHLTHRGNRATSPGLSPGGSPWEMRFSEFGSRKSNNFPEHVIRFSSRNNESFEWVCFLLELGY